MEYDAFLRMRHAITQKIPEELSNNRELVLDIVRKNCLALEYVSDALRDDYVVVEAAVQQNGMALKFASERLKNLHSLVKSAVLENGRALQYASEVLRGDVEILTCALWSNRTAIEFASHALQNMENPLEFDMKESNECEKNRISNHFSYAVIKELCSEAQLLVLDMGAEQFEIIFERLNIFINKVRTIIQLSSQDYETDEVASDLEWIEQYYEKNEWVSIVKWLKNLQSSLHEMWSNYIDKIIALKTQ